jgi:hypothetical protein
MVIYNVWALAVVVPAIMLFEGNADKAMKAAFILMIPLDLALRGAMAYSRRALSSQVWIEMMILPSYGVAIFFLPILGVGVVARHSLRNDCVGRLRRQWTSTGSARGVAGRRRFTIE